MLKYIFAFAIMFSPLISENKPQPYHSFKKPEKFEYTAKDKSNLSSLIKLIKKIKAKTIVEMGAWNGQDTYIIAKNLKDNCVIFAYEDWMVDGKENPELEKIYPGLFDHFLSNLTHKRQIHKIIPLRLDYEEALYVIYKQEETVDILYFNTAHSQEVIVDSKYLLFDRLCDLYGIVDKRGYICGNCYGRHKWEIEEFADEHYMDIHVEGDFWAIAKIDAFVR